MSDLGEAAGLRCGVIAVLMTALSRQADLNALIGTGLIVGFRAAAIHWRLVVPDWLRLESQQPDG